MECPHCSYILGPFDTVCPRCGKAPGDAAGPSPAPGAAAGRPAYEADLAKQVMDRAKVGEAQARRALEQCDWAVEPAVSSIRGGRSRRKALLVAIPLVLALAVGAFATIRHVSADRDAAHYIPKTQPEGWRKIGHWTAAGGGPAMGMPTKKLGTFTVTRTWKLVCGTSPGPEDRVLTPMMTVFGVCEAGKVVEDIEETGHFVEVQVGGQGERTFEGETGTFDLLVRAGTRCEAEVWERTQ